MQMEKEQDKEREREKVAPEKQIYMQTTIFIKSGII